MLQGIGITPNTSKGILYPYQHIPPNVKSGVIVFVDEFEPKHVLEVSKDLRTVGLIARYGSLTCHAANLFEELVLLTNRNLTAIVALGDVALERIVGNEVVLDGVHGTIELTDQTSHESLSVFAELSNNQSHYWRRKTQRIEVYRAGKKWTCHRPHYHFSLLDASLIAEGFQLSNQVLFNEPPCEVMFDESGRFWLSGEASPERIKEAIIDSPDWFIQKAGEQHVIFDGFIDEILGKQVLWQRGTNTTMIRDGILFLQRCITEFYSRLPLTMNTYEPLFSDFVNSLQSANIPRYKAFQFLRSLSRSSYSSTAFRLSAFHVLQKWLQFPAAEPKVIRAEVEFNKISPYDVEFESETLPSLSITERAKLVTLRKVVPVMFEIKEEKFYVSKALLGWMNVLLDQASSLLVKKGVINASEEILNLTIDRILGHLAGPEEAK